MKLIILAVALFALGAQASQLRAGLQFNDEKAAYIYEDEIRAAIEQVRQLLRNGIPDKGIPPLDPLNIGNIDVDLSSLGIPNVSGKVKLENAVSNGIAGWADPEVDVSVTIFPPGASFTFLMRWPEISASGDYDIDAAGMGHTVSGSGKQDGRLTNLAVSLRGSYNALTGNVRGLNAEIILEDATLELGSLAIDGVEISQDIEAIAKRLPAWIIEHQAQLDALMEALVEWINNRYF